MRVTGDGGVGIEVCVDGPYDGKPVLLMHGWPDTHRLWRHQVAALTDAGYRTIAPDLRGFGASDKPTEVEAYKLTHSVVDMLAVLDALDVSSAAVVATTGERWPAGAWRPSRPTGSSGTPHCPSGTRRRSWTPGSRSGCARSTCCCSTSRSSPSSGFGVRRPDAGEPRRPRGRPRRAGRAGRADRRLRLVPRQRLTQDDHQPAAGAATRDPAR